MITIRRSEERGAANHGWLDTKHTFSFADYYDSQHMGFRSLRVINEDKVQGEEGFGTHPHRDMEILTYVLSGKLEHKDNMGNGSSIRRGEVQRMSAGTGVLHSEANTAPDWVHFFQIWIVPKQRGLAPSYEQKMFPEADKTGKLLRVADAEGKDGAVKVHQDVSVFASVLNPGQSVTHAFERGGYGWVQVASGEVDLNGVTLKAGDGAQLSEEKTAELKAREKSELLLFDLA